jgi:hypothetical protein
MGLAPMLPELEMKNGSECEIQSRLHNTCVIEVLLHAPHEGQPHLASRQKSEAVT